MYVCHLYRAECTISVLLHSCVCLCLVKHLVEYIIHLLVSSFIIIIIIIIILTIVMHISTIQFIFNVLVV